MLQAIRSKAGSVFVKILFGALILSFGIWGIGDIFRNAPPDTVVATVGDQGIRAEDLQTALQPALERLRAQFGGTVDLQQAKQLGVVDTVLGQLVDRSLVDQEVARLRLDVSDAVISTAIVENPAFRGADGKFDRALFNQALSMNRLSEDQYVAMFRRDLPRADLVHALTVGAAAPQPLIDAIYRYRNEKRVADIVAFPLTAAAAAGAPGDAELTRFYNAHKDLFGAPEYRGFTLATLVPADIEKDTDIPEAKLKQEFDQRQDEFQVPERREVEQILAPSEAKAKAAAAALAAGKDWKEVATTIAGQDPDTIDLGLMKRSELPRQLADIAFGLALDTPSAPVESSLGWHILRVVKIEPASTQTFDQAKAKLKQDVAHDAAVDRLYKIANEADDALAGGAALADVTAKFGLKTTVVAAADVGGRDPDGKPIALPVAAAEVLKAAFATAEGDTTRVTETQDGDIFVLHCDKVIPPQVRPLAKVRDQAVAAWQADRKRANVAQAAAALAAAAAPAASLAAVARQQGLSVTTSPPLLRRPEAGSAVSGALVAKLFDAKTGAVVTAADESGSYVAQLKEIQVPEATPAADGAALGQQLSGDMRSDIADEFTRALRNRFPVAIHRAALDRMF